METVILFKANEMSEMPETSSEAEQPPPTRSELKKIIFDITKWVGIMSKEIEYLIDQAHVLLELKERLNLAYEVNCFRALQTELEQRMVVINEQADRLRVIRIEIETEATKQEEAKHNDECARLLNVMTAGLGDKSVPQVSLGDPGEWLNKIQGLIKNSREERRNSLLVLPGAHSVLILAANKSFAIWNATNALYRNAIKIVKVNKAKADKTYFQIIKEIKILDTYFKDLQEGINKKTIPLRKAESAIEKRKFSSGLDLCSDPITLKLLKQVQFIKLGIDALQKRADEVEGALAMLEKHKKVTEKRLYLFKQSLLVDEVKGLRRRNQNPVSTFFDLRFQFGGKPQYGQPMPR